LEKNQKTAIMFSHLPSNTRIIKDTKVEDVFIINLTHAVSTVETSEFYKTAKSSLVSMLMS